jgi:hypothetical protein
LRRSAAGGTGVTKRSSDVVPFHYANTIREYVPMLDSIGLIARLSMWPAILWKSISGHHSNAVAFRSGG